MVEFEILGKKVIIKDPCFEIDCKIQDETIEIDEEGNYKMNKGVGHFKKIKLFNYLISIDNKSYKFDEIGKLSGKLCEEILKKIVENEEEY